MNLVGSFEVGNLRVSMVSDGVSMAPRGPGWFTGIDPAEWMPAIGVDSPDALLPVNFGGFLIEGEGHITLVDCGFGEMAKSMPHLEGGAAMLDQMASLDVAPDDVDRIIQTHMHADHCGWLIDSTDNPELTFPNATVFIDRAEVAYWRSSASDDNLAPDYTRARLSAVADADRLEEVHDDVVLEGGVEILSTPGHTPGHVSVMVRSGGESALLLGDVAHHCIHLERHNWHQSYDVDRPAAVATRGRMAALAVAEDAIVTAPHMPALTLVRLEKTDTGYRYHQVD